jgi:hypothetical protein
MYASNDILAESRLMTGVLVRHMSMENRQGYRRTPGQDMRARAPATIAEMMMFS